MNLLIRMNKILEIAPDSKGEITHEAATKGKYGIYYKRFSKSVDTGVSLFSKLQYIYRSNHKSLQIIIIPIMPNFFQLIPFAPLATRA